jgi:hypothetical protein
LGCNVGAIRVARGSRSQHFTAHADERSVQSVATNSEDKFEPVIPEELLQPKISVELSERTLNLIDELNKIMHKHPNDELYKNLQDFYRAIADDRAIFNINIDINKPIQEVLEFIKTTSEITERIKKLDEK